MTDKLAKRDESIVAEVCYVAELEPDMSKLSGARLDVSKLRAEQDAREAKQIALQQTAYPMRGRFHCCDPKIVDVFHADSGEYKTACICELCGWEFQSQRYVPVPTALPADTTPPPMAADCNEPKRGEHATIRKLARNAAGAVMRKLRG